MTIPAAELAKDWWDITIQRNSSLAGSYAGDVIVSHVELTYERA